MILIFRILNHRLDVKNDVNSPINDIRLKFMTLNEFEGILLSSN